MPLLILTMMSGTWQFCNNGILMDLSSYPSYSKTSRLVWIRWLTLRFMDLPCIMTSLVMTLFGFLRCPHWSQYWRKGKTYWRVEFESLSHLMSATCGFDQLLRHQVVRRKGKQCHQQVVYYSLKRFTGWPSLCDDHSFQPCESGSMGDPVRITEVSGLSRRCCRES